MQAFPRMPLTSHGFTMLVTPTKQSITISIHGTTASIALALQFDYIAQSLDTLATPETVGVL